MSDNTNLDLKHALGPAPPSIPSSNNDANITNNSTPRSLQFTPIPEAGPAPQGTADKSSRWTARDDVILADALIAQKNLGRSHNAVFTIEAWNEVVEKLKGSEVVSGGAQKTMTQCKARWQRLKIEYRTVKHLRSQPGFSWDDTTQMVTGLAATWDEYISEHRDAQPWRKKSFPAYGRVAHILEDENGHDAGEEQFKRRWGARAIKSHGSGLDTTSGSVGTNEEGSENAPPSTGVFSVSAPPDPQNIQFAAPIMTSGSMSVPFNGSGMMHNYRIKQPQTSNKRRQSPSVESASSKRSRSITSTTASITEHQQQQQQVQPQPTLDQYSNAYSYGYAPVPQMTLPPTPVSTTSVPSGAGPISPSYSSYTSQPGHLTPIQLSQPSGQSAQSRMAAAIRIVEETESLTEEDFVRAVQLFQRRPETVEAYLTIKNQKLRGVYLNAELKQFVV